jgi:NTP pyrophosphatase (non-canonical NTP hydrolase)
MANNDLTGVFYDLLCMTRKDEDAPDWACGLKLGAEAGEVQEAILKARDFIKHKELDEDVIHEIADVMNVCCAILTSHYPERTPIALTNDLADAMVKKGKKYADILDANVPQLGHYSNARFNRRHLKGQMVYLHRYVEDELGEPASVHMYQDGGVMVETDAGRGFGFDTLESLIENIGDFKRD